MVVERKFTFTSANPYGGTGVIPNESVGIRIKMNTDFRTTAVSAVLPSGAKVKPAIWNSTGVLVATGDEYTAPKEISARLPINSPFILEGAKEYTIGFIATNTQTVFVNTFSGQFNASSGSYVATLSDNKYSYYRNNDKLGAYPINENKDFVLVVGLYWAENSKPTLDLTTPNNKTLYENDAFAINGSTTDTDNGDAVTVKYQINSGTVRNLHSAISDGVTPIPFSKSLTYKEGILFDGSTALTSVLAAGTPHVISVWAEDGNGGKSAVETRTFYVVPNRPPTLTIEPIAKQTDKINSETITVNGVVGDLDNNDVVVTFAINDGEAEEIHDGAPGAFAFNIVLKDLRTGSNTVVIKATDVYDAAISKVLTINKTHDAVPVNEAIALYKINPPTGSAKKILLWIERMLGDLAITAEVSMTNEGEPENFVSLPRTNTGPKEGLIEDEFAYQDIAEKTNIVVKIIYTRTSSAAVETIKKISGVLS